MAHGVSLASDSDLVGADAQLQTLLAGAPEAIVAAFDPRGTLVPIPSTVSLQGQRAFDGTTGLDLILPADQRAVADAWLKIDQQPVITVPVHLLADPDHLAAIHLFDVRDEYGVHILVFEGGDPDLVARSSDVRSTRRRGTARVKRDGVSRFIEV